MKEIETPGTSTEPGSEPLEHVVTEKTGAPETHTETTRTETSHEAVPAKDVEVKETTVTKQ